MPMREAAHLLFDNKITEFVVDNGKLVGVLISLTSSTGRLMLCSWA